MGVTTISSLPLFLHKVSRRLKRYKKIIRVRLLQKWPELLIQDLGELNTNTLWREDSIAISDPIDWKVFELRGISNNLKEEVNNCLSHKFRIFSDDVYDVSANENELAKEIHEILPNMSNELIDAYKRIDWHTDFKSGYTWDKQSLYLDNRPAPIAGVEIKNPWQLSRFDHVGLLAQAPFEIGANEFILQTIDWILSNPFKKGVNWVSAHEVSIRLNNLLWGLRIFSSEIVKHECAIRLIKQSLFNHACHIADNLDYYIESTDDHYLSNLTGLAHLAVLFPEFPKSSEWLTTACREIESESRRQVLSDGYSDMMSSNYHKFVTELFSLFAITVEGLPKDRKAFVCESLNISDDKRKESNHVISNRGNAKLLSNDFYLQLNKMARILAALTKPNQSLVQFGDNDSSDALVLFPRNESDSTRHLFVVELIGLITGDKALIKAGRKYEYEAKFYAERIGKQIFHSENLQHDIPKYYPDAGIAILENQTAFVAVICGNNGRGGKGGHGHNDKLSFELNLFESDYIVDGGCPFYTGNPELRNAYRSTVAHSTINMEGAEQDSIPPGLDGLFFLPGSSSPELTQKSSNEVSGHHSGFSHPHNRSFFLDDNYLHIHDRLDNNGGEKAFLRFNFSPSVECAIEQMPNNVVKCVLKCNSNPKVLLTVSDVSTAELTEGFYSRGFGRPEKNQLLAMELTKESVDSRFSW